MRILIVAYHFEVTAARYITDAFKRLGHDVRHVGQPARLQDAWGVPVTPGHEWTPDGDLCAHWTDWSPDLIILADTLPETFNYRAAFGYQSIPIVYWSNDNHVRNVRRDGIAHYFLAHAHGPAQPVTHDDETWLPCASDTRSFNPSPIPWDERAYDVAMVGVMYPRRLRLVQMLHEAGFTVWAGTGAIYETYRDAYHNARISLCVSAAGDVAQRVYETAGMGCHVLTDPLLDLSDDSLYEKPEYRDYRLAGFSVYGNYDRKHFDSAEAYQRYVDNDCVDCVRRLLTTDKHEAIAATQGLQTIVQSKHDWTNRAQVVINWYHKEYGGIVTWNVIEEKPVIKIAPTLPVEAQTLPMLNLGCGKTHLPSEPPPGHEGVDPAIYQYPHWLNVDKVKGVGADMEFDLFRYPWPLADNNYSGALCAHILEHIPHEIRPNNSFWEDWILQEKDHNLGELFKGQMQNALDRWTELSELQDGWYAFFSELYRVLIPGSIVHVVSPYGWSDGGITDPSHTRYLTVNTFYHSMTPNADGATFQYDNGGINFKVVKTLYRASPMNIANVRLPTDNEETALFKNVHFRDAVMSQLNALVDFYIQLECVK